MSIDNAKEIFDLLYKEIDGMAVSLSARRKLDYWYVGHVYGEVTYREFMKMLAMTRPQKNEVFYDLGSGTGKAVMLAAMLSNFSKAVGVEILKELYDTSVQVLHEYRKLMTEQGGPEKEIQFINSDFRAVDFSDADIVFMNATCMLFEFDKPFIRKLELLKKGARVITNTIFIPSGEFSVKNIGPVAFTWGDEEVFIHTRI